MLIPIKNILWFTFFIVAWSLISIPFESTSVPNRENKFIQANQDHPNEIKRPPGFTGHPSSGRIFEDGPLNKSDGHMKTEFTGNSVLAEGKWLKLGIIKSGIYKLDYDYLSKSGINLSGIDPRTIRIFGNGCFMLPQENSHQRQEDLAENRIFVKGESDGQFDNSDYVLFYGQSPDKLELYDAGGTAKVDYLHNLYSDTSFYFLTYGTQAGKRIETKQNIDALLPEITTYDDLTVHENDIVNILESGREWYGEKFDLKSTYDFSYDFQGIKQGSSLQVISGVMGQSFNGASFDLSVNGTKLGTQVIGEIPDATYGLKGRDASDTFSINTNLIPNPEAFKLTYHFIKSTSGKSTGYLNYFIIRCERDLAYRNENLIFRSGQSLSNAESTFKINNVLNETRVWDITSPLEPAEQEIKISNGLLSFGTETQTLKTFIAFNDNLAKQPVSEMMIANQDLHGSAIPDLLIISNPAFLGQARDLADFRMTESGMNVLVVSVGQVYNEFSSGAQDVTAIRDFIRYLWEKGAGTGLKNVLLFGKSSFDYKDHLKQNTNFVPIYESRNSLHPVFSYASDDYFTLLEEQEGYWDESSQGDETMDVGIGRIPVVSVTEADILINKITNYESGKNRFGDWRSRICFVADDGDGVDGTIHSRDADKLASYVDTSFTDYSIKKIYVDAYPQIVTPNKQTVPEAKNDLNAAINNGTMIVNFTGHGSESQWTSEAILDLDMIARFTNRDRLALFVTATCEFGRHDNPVVRSGAEYALINDRGGAIALVTTSRPVFSSTNYQLNTAFYQNVFAKENNAFLTLGEIFRRTKNSSLNGPVNRNFSLLGDPSLMLAYPENRAWVSHINDLNTDLQQDTLKAMKLIRIDGLITDQDGNKMDSYNGSVTVTVYDKSVARQTLGAQDPVMEYTTRDNIIFKGLATVKNGSYRSEFIVPKNINYNLGEGRINLYSITDAGTDDAIGSNVKLFVGGTQSDFLLDQKPPDVELFLYDTVNSQENIIGSNPVLLARIHDESGISTSNYSLEKGIIAELDNMEFDLTHYYLADRDSYKNGTVEYQFFNLTDGPHHLVLTARDTYNNAGKAYLDFVVTDKSGIIIGDVYNFPNPVLNETTFSFVHNRAGEDLEVIIDIYNMTGAFVREINTIISDSDFKVNNIKWDATNSSGKKLQTGIYIYTVSVRSLYDGTKNVQHQKLIINY
jgi:hypothetical protein